MIDTEKLIQNLPEMTTDTQAVPGKNTLLFVKVSQTGWALIGGQKNSPLTQKAESLDGSDKTTGGWAKGLPGMKSWSIEYDGLYVLGDVGLAILRKQYREGAKVYVRIVYPGGQYVQGWASVTEFSDSNAADAIHTVKVSLTGYGAISDLITPSEPGIKDPQTPAASFTLTSPENLIFLVESLDDGRQLRPLQDYTQDGDKLTFTVTGVSAARVYFASKHVDVKLQ